MRGLLVAAVWLVAVGAQADAGPPPPTADAGAEQDSGDASLVPTTTAPAEAEKAPTAEAAVPPKKVTFAAMRDQVGDQSLASRAMGLVGILVCLGFAFLLSRSRRDISWRLVGIGVGLQFVFAVLVLKTGLGRKLFEVANVAVTRLLSFSVDGARFIFGGLVDQTVPVLQGGQPTDMVAQTGAFLAFGVLPTILFFSAMTSVLYYLGVLQWVVRGMAFVMRRLMGTSGAESLSASANIFVGQTEAPLLVRPYLARMTNSELMAVMTGGFATVAGGVMAVYVAMLQETFPDIAGHLLAASVMSAPASLVMSKIIVPETETPETLDGEDAATVDPAADDERGAEEGTANVLDAITQGTTDGLKLALNVGAMLISFVAIVALLNWMIGGVASALSDEVWTLQRILGVILAPFAFLLGVPWEDAPQVGAMMGTKTVINEFLAYIDLSGAMQAGTLSHPKSVVIATYALCGFSNLGSIGIQIGGLSTMAPSRRADLARLGFISMIAASLACFQTAALAGLLL